MDSVLIGKNIKSARVMAGMSQKILASKLGISWEMVSRYENGRSNSLNHISDIAIHLSKNLDFFFKNNQLTKPYNNKVPFLFELTGELKANLTKVDMYYRIPEWVENRYKDVFALKLSGIKKTNLDFNKNDVGIFTFFIEEQFKFYLSGDELIDTQPSTEGNFAGLIYIERRYV